MKWYEFDISGEANKLGIPQTIVEQIAIEERKEWPRWRTKERTMYELHILRALHAYKQK